MTIEGLLGTYTIPAQRRAPHAGHTWHTTQKRTRLQYKELVALVHQIYLVHPTQLATLPVRCPLIFATPQHAAAQSTPT